VIDEAKHAEPAHGHDLAEDLALISARLKRRRALTWLAAAGSAWLLDACGGSSDSSDSTSTTSTATTSSGSTTITTSSCVADPQETSGPYPADGTNTSSGSTSDALTASGIVRSDIRSSFISSTTVAQGVQLTLTLTLVNTSSSCAVLAGYAIYLWHCDESGNYSLYSAPTESYLRGVQVTDSAGQVTFTTIFPACYSGRYPHMHLEIFSSLSSATTGRNSLLTTQLAMPSEVCSAVYANVSGYSASVANLAAVSVSSDNVFGDNTDAQIAAMTPTMTGSVSEGYVGAATVGIAL